MKKTMWSILLATLALSLPPAASAGEVQQWTNSFGMSFSLIPAGKTVIGRFGWAGVEPRREVTLSRDFGMGTTEVTQGQWKAVMGGKNPSEPFLGDDLPVNRVSWNDAQAFVKKLNELDAPRRYRLPSSAEWEHAYRAGNQATWITGDGTPAFPQSLSEYEWFGPDKKTHPVAQKKPNDWGLYDMGGNVREWVQDFWQHDYYGSMPATDPTGPKAGNLRVWRGGSYEDPLETCSFVSRDGDKPTARNKWTGFRVVLEGESLRSALGGESLRSALGDDQKAEAAQPALEAKGAIPADIPAAYVPVLDNMHGILAQHQPDREWQDGEYGVMERWQGNAGPETLDSVGWALRDLNADGQPELLIAPVGKAENGKTMGNQLYAIHTMKDGKALLVQEGTDRNAFTLINGGMLKHHGSGGAMMQIFGICGLSAEGTLVWHDYWFTDSKNEAHEIGYYWNDKGTTDKSLSQEIPKAAFEKAEEALLLQKSVEIEFTTFKDWRKAEGAPDQPAQPAVDTPAVRIRWADSALREALDHETFIASSEQPQIEVAICAESTVKNVKVLKLDFVDVDENGKARFNTAELFHKGQLEPKYPLVLGIPMLGTIPHYGVSYEDENGRAHRFAITQSGKDGSPQLTPF